MADREKVMKGLKCCSGANRVCMYVQTANECPYAELIEEDWYGCDSNVECTKALAADALELLKEQEPKLVRYTASIVRCPNCNKQITTKGCIHREIKYCWKCGQAVKWDD